MIRYYFLNLALVLLISAWLLFVLPHILIIYAVLVLLCSASLVLIVPAIYKREKAQTIACAEGLSHELPPRHYPVAAVLMFTVPVMIKYLSGGDLILSICTFIFAMIAYTDLAARWVPDCLSYCLMVLSIMYVRDDLTTALWATLFYSLPVILLALFGYITRKESWFASGDYCIIPSVGLLIYPEYSAGLMLVNLGFLVVVARYVNMVPFVTIMYASFTGYQLCSLSGLF